jgi:small subunit ribosomal protein S2
MKDLIEAGVHFGHHTRRWNPKMAPYVFGIKDKVHIIDLGKTVPMLHAGLTALRNVAAAGGKILFVGTRPHAAQMVGETAEACGQFHVNKRWLGGLMTNWKTVVNSIRKMKKSEADIANAEALGLTKKETVGMEKEVAKLRDTLGGVMDMNGAPNILFVLDVSKEDLAVEEAVKLGIPIVGICDTNSDPSKIDFPVPGNDDALGAVRLYLDLALKAVLDGLEEQLKRSGADLGAALNPAAAAASAPAEEQPAGEKKTEEKDG